MAATPPYNIVDFRLFVQLAECGNLTQAAARLCLSAPAASGRLKRMEEAAGLPLFRRGTGGMTLTPAGQTYQRHAADVLARLDALSADLAAHRAPRALRILANTIVVTQLLPAPMSRYLQQRPEVQIELQERLSHETVESLLAGSADIGIVSAGVDVQGLHTRPFASSRLVAVALHSHAIAQGGDVAFRDLAAHDFVSLMPGTTTSACLRSIAERMRLQLRTRVQVQSFGDVCTMVRNGIGVGIVPAAAVEHLQADETLAIRELADPWARSDYLLCSRDPATLAPHVRDFLGTASSHWQPAVDVPVDPLRMPRQAQPIEVGTAASAALPGDGGWRAPRPQSSATPEIFTRSP